MDKFLYSTMGEAYCKDGKRGSAMSNENKFAVGCVACVLDQECPVHITMPIQLFAIHCKIWHGLNLEPENDMGISLVTTG